MPMGATTGECRFDSDTLHEKELRSHTREIFDFRGKLKFAGGLTTDNDSEHCVAIA